MAIVNRDLSPSQQIAVMSAALELTVGASAAIGWHVCELPFPATLKSVAIAARAISGSPSVSIGVKRFTAAGVTSIDYVGATLAPVAYGISGYATQLFSVTSFSLQTGDVVYAKEEFSTALANTATTNAVVTVVVQATQDIKSYFGTAY